MFARAWKRAPAGADGLALVGVATAGATMADQPSLPRDAFTRNGTSLDRKL